MCSSDLDHTKPASVYECDFGMASEDCVHFGGQWDMPDNITVIIGMPETLDIQELIECAGCSCMCRCMCVSIWSRDVANEIEFTGQNDVACAVVGRDMIPFCDEGEVPGARYAVWESHGWQLRLDGGIEHWPDIAVNIIGTQVNYSPCTLQNMMMFIDGREHEIIADNGTAQVEYELNIADRTPLQMVWGGLSHAKTSSIKFEVWDWNLAVWDELGSVGGRDNGVDVARTFRSNLDPEHVDGTGDMKIRLTMTGGTVLKTDQLKIITTRCCKIELIPPYEVMLESAPALLDLSELGQCPSPFKFWELRDVSGREWYVTAECRWCGNSCGSTGVSCCPNPIPRTLFAEVQLGCTGCAASAFVVPLIATSPFIWEGDITVCGSVFTVRFDCDTIRVEGAGACSFQGSPTSVFCSPFQADYSGEFGGGIGCCGVGSTDTAVTITVTVIE